MAAASSDIIYLEVDEDITSAIDKLVRSKATNVQIVAPKRSTLIQSLINLKLLKKAAADNSKQLVLVTGDRTASHLAGRVGLAVAKSVGATAAVPETVTAEPEDVAETIDGSEEADADEAAAATEAASLPAVPEVTPVAPRPLATSQREVGDDGDRDAESAAEPLAATGAAAKPKMKAPRIPDFNTMQKRLLIGGGILAVIILWLVGNYFFTRATVTLYAKGTAVPTNFNFTVDPSAKSSDNAKSVVVGQALSLDKDLTATVNATGTKDIGTKASGSVTIKNCEDTNPRILAAGTTMTASGKNFVTNSAASVPAGSFSGGGTKCNSTTVSVAVTAAENGDSYNLAPTSYTSAALAGNFSLTGGQMSGGTSKKVAVITQADVDAAKQAVLDKDKDGSTKDVAAKAASGYKTLADSLAVTVASASSSPDVGAEGQTAALTIKVNYAMLAYNQSDLSVLIKAKEQKQVGDDSQIYDDGLEGSTIKAGAKATGGGQEFSYTATAYAGKKIDATLVASSLAGKRYGDAVDAASKLDGIDKAEIALSPAWASRLPSIAHNIKVIFKIAPRG